MRYLAIAAAACFTIGLAHAESLDEARQKAVERFATAEEDCLADGKADPQTVIEACTLLIASGRKDAASWGGVAEEKLPAVHVRRGEAYLAQSDILARSRAFQDFAIAITIDPDHVEAYRARAAADAAHMETNGLDPALVLRRIADLGEIARLEPENDLVWLDLARSHALLAEWEAALEQIDTAISLAPKAENVNMRAAIRLAMNDVPAALADFDRAVAEGPEFAAGWAGRAIARTASRDLAATISDLSRAIDLDRRNEGYFIFRAGAYLLAGQPAEALSDLYHAIALTPLHATNVLAYSWRAAALALLGRQQDARADCLMLSRVTEGRPKTIVSQVCPDDAGTVLVPQADYFWNGFATVRSDWPIYLKVGAR